METTGTSAVPDQCNLVLQWETNVRASYSSIGTIREKTLQHTSTTKSHKLPNSTIPPTDVNRRQKFSGNSVCNGFSDLKWFKSSCSVSGSYFDRACGVLEQVVLTVKVQVWATRIDGIGCEKNKKQKASRLLLPSPRRDRFGCLWPSHAHKSQECISLPLEPAGNSAFFYLFIMSEHSTNGWGCGVNCAYLHLGNWQSSLQQNGASIHSERTGNPMSGEVQERGRTRPGERGS